MLIRLNHTGQRSCEEAVLANLIAYAKGLEAGGHSTNLEYALLTAVDAYRL